MIDFFSQSVLYPIHLGLFQGLKRIPSDRTFVQADGLDLGPPSGSYHSLDLSSATDRFPMQLQKEVMIHLIGEEKAEAWARILTKWPYIYQGKSVFYKTGQPMGAYSSWSAFTLTHHLVVYVAARLAKARLDCYVLLGDDIVIADDSVAENYRMLLRSLDVPLSEAKTHTSKDVYEFAKRWWYKGVEVTPFPFHGLIETVKKYHLLLELLRQAAARGFDSTAFLRHPGLLDRLLFLNGFRGRQIVSYIRKFELTASIPLAGDTPEQVYSKAKTFCRVARVHLSCNAGFPEVIRIFESHGANALTWTLARETERIMKVVVTWGNQVQQAVSRLPVESADQAELLDNVVGTLPVLEALSAKADASMNSIGPDEITGTPGNNIWDKASRMKLTLMPGVKGINPTRSSYQMAGSRATWALNLARIWRRYEQGLRP